ncbi:MAG: ribonuclease J, partial [Metamycoplasmataceae bacterium]
MANIRFFALGGLDENGKNSYVLEINDDIFLINYGTKTPISSTNGIDTLIADYDYIQENIKRVRGIFITNINNENFSALPWLLMKIQGLKIYCSTFSSFVIKDRLSKYDIGNSNYEIITMNSKGTKIGNILIKPLLLASSVPGTFGYQFETEDGNVLFMNNFVNGDLGIFGNTNLNFIKNENKNILALICDSGMANFNGRTIDNIDIKKSLEKAFINSKSNERIIVGVYDNDLASSYQILELALKYDKNIVAYGKTFHQLIDIIKSANKNIKFPKIIDYKRMEKEENCVIIISGTTERLYKRFLRISDGEDLYLKLKNDDRVIMIAPPINGLETQSTFMLDEVARITPHIYDYSSLEHYSYRPAKQDIVDIVSILKPKYFLPIQGLYRYMVVASKELQNNNFPQNKIIILKNGRIAEFINGELDSQNKRIANAGDIIIDGFGIGDISKEVIFEREIIARDGVIIVSLVINDKEKKIYDNIDIKYM